MAETLAALILAHALADFVLQNDWIVANKRRPEGLALHGLIVLVCAILCTGTLSWGLVWLAALHLAIDAWKARARRGLAPFLIDQAAHLASLAALAIWQPDLWSRGIWSDLPALPAVALILAGAILATRAGGFAIGLLMEPFATRLLPEITAESLPGAGRVIGHLERGLIFALILLGQAQGVGLLIAAKSIFRFPAAQAERRQAEYFLLGTLLSFALGIGIALATEALLPR